jgi:Flp pilus assembly pilin Flp
MEALRNLLPDVAANEPGGRTIEYGLLAVGIMVACIAAAAALGGGLDASPQRAAYAGAKPIYSQLAAPMPVNDQSTSLRQNQLSVGVGR